MTVLEELDYIKNGNRQVSAEARSAIRTIDKLIGECSTDQLQAGVKILRPNGIEQGTLSISIDKVGEPPESCLSNHNNDNKIINTIMQMQIQDPETQYILVSKDINMRLKARGTHIMAEDYQKDQLVSDIKHINSGYHQFKGSIWDQVVHVDTIQKQDATFYSLSPELFVEQDICVNQYIYDDVDFLGCVEEVTAEHILIRHMKKNAIMSREAWGLAPRNLFQAMALDALLNPDLKLVNLTGQAGSGKTILALAAAIEMTIEQKLFNKIIVTRSTPALAEDHGFLPGTEEEKMDPWLGAIHDNIEALHIKDESPNSSIEFVRERANIQFKALNYIRGRSFQRSLILIDESQNLTPHQMKAIVTRAGEGSKVVCLGNLSQIDTPYLNAFSSGLTYLTERFKGFKFGASVRLEGSPRSELAEFAEMHL